MRLGEDDDSEFIEQPTQNKARQSSLVYSKSNTAFLWTKPISPHELSANNTQHYVLMT